MKFTILILILALSLITIKVAAGENGTCDIKLKLGEEIYSKALAAKQKNFKGVKHASEGDCEDAVLGRGKITNVSQGSFDFSRSSVGPEDANGLKIDCTAHRFIEALVNSYHFTCADLKEVLRSSDCADLGKNVKFSNSNAAKFPTGKLVKVFGDCKNPDSVAYVKRPDGITMEAKIKDFVVSSGQTGRSTDNGKPSGRTN